MTAAEKPAASRRWVLDTSALLAFRADEAGADRVERLLRHASRHAGSVLVSFMSRMEMLYCVSREESLEAANNTIRLLDTTAILWVSCEARILETAARLKADGGLSVADAWIAATAHIHGATLVHKDPEFAALRGIMQEDLSR